MSLQLADKRMVVTGGSQGIGAEIVRACMDNGASAAALDVNDDAGRALVEKLVTLTGCVNSIATSGAANRSAKYFSMRRTGWVLSMCSITSRV